MSCKVFLVGAGPGDPELLTIKGMRCLRQAEVVLYDRLANPVLLDYAPAEAVRINVGKAPQRHRLSQEKINATLIGKAQLGLRVVRLKGGDPFVFGRGGEEALALARAGISYEVVPGISSALAVPAYAGIPVTQRRLSQAFTVVTGHTAAGTPSSVDWSALPLDGTLVILMGVRSLPKIAAPALFSWSPDRHPGGGHRTRHHPTAAGHYRHAGRYRGARQRCTAPGYYRRGRGRAPAPGPGVVSRGTPIPVRYLRTTVRVLYIQSRKNHNALSTNCPRHFPPSFSKTELEASQSACVGASF